MAKSPPTRPQLSFVQAMAMGREFIAIGDQIFDYMSQLRKAGFQAFQPRHEFVESFAQGDEELQVHRRCVVEEAKEQIAQQVHMRLQGGERKHVWFSPYLQRLREERDEANGVPIHELYTRYDLGESAWRREVDPCLRRMIQTEVNQRDRYEALWTSVLDAQRRALEDEAEHHATGHGRYPHTFDNKGRYGFFSAVMERDAGPLGFRYDQSKSRPNYPIFSKAITEDWHLCWAIEEARAFFHNPFEGRFRPYLQLRSRTLRGWLANADPWEFMHIKYAGCVPGFYQAYQAFFSLDELEIEIKANLYLYSLMAPIIEGGIKKVLGAASARQM
jgi:hypothetical protein